MELNPSRCYRALTSRDRRFDGRFFVGVRTTGIYCRPVCPSPKPRREHVTFYACAAAAEDAGFRPCRRCRPEAAPGSPAWTGSAAVVGRALRLIADGALDEGDSEALAARLGVGARHLRRLFDQHLGTSPGAVARAARAHFARQLLDATDLPMTEIAASAGFASVRQFNHAMQATFRETPRALRARRRALDGPSAGLGLRLRLAYRPPLAWTALLGFLRARAIPGVELVTGDAYHRVVTLGAGAGTVTLRPQPDAGLVELTLHLDDLTAAPSIVARARRLLDLDADPLAIATALGRHPLLAPAVRDRPGLRVPGAWEPFEIAVRAVLGQQVTVRGATTLAGRLVERFGAPVDTSVVPGLRRAFPSPDVLADAPVESIGVPSARAAAVRGLAAAVAAGTLRLDAGADPAALRDGLQAIPGIGRWTAEYVAMRAGGDTDAFPSGDLWLRRAAGNGAGPLTAAALDRTAEAWRPWRAYAAMHLWTGGTHGATAGG